MLKKIIVVFAVLISSLMLSQVALAQTQSTTQVDGKGEYPISVLLLGDALVLKGAGLKATYKVADHFSVGALGKVYKLESTDDDYSYWTTKSKHELTTVGLVVDFFPINTVDRRGLYISAAATSVHAKTTVDDTMFGTNSSTHDRIGGQISVGYQFAINIAKAAQILFQVGGGYGNGGSIEYKYFSGSETKIKDSLLLDLSGGVQF